MFCEYVPRQVLDNVRARSEQGQGEILLLWLQCGSTCSTPGFLPFGLIALSNVEE